MSIFTAFEWLLGSQGADCGAIDVVAIQQSDGTIQCSPFHVKLSKGKKNIKVVRVKVNGKDTELLMKVGQAGEVFFLEHTQRQEFIAKRYRSSPPVSPRNTATVDRKQLPGIDSDNTKNSTISTYLEQVAGDENKLQSTSSVVATLITTQLSGSVAEDRSPLFNQQLDATGKDSKSAAWTWTWGDLPMKSKGDNDSGTLSPNQYYSEAPTVGADELLNRSDLELSMHNLDLEENYYGSVKILSICGHVLTEILKSRNDVRPSELFQVIRAHAITRNDFFTSPQEYISNPNLVVLVNGVMLPWSIAQAMFTAVFSTFNQSSSTNLANEFSSNSEYLLSTGVSSIDDDTACIMEIIQKHSDTDSATDSSLEAGMVPIWAGRHIFSWSKFSNENVETDLHSQKLGTVLEGNEGMSSRHSINEVLLGAGIEIDTESIDQSSGSGKLRHSIDDEKGNLDNDTATITSTPEAKEAFKKVLGPNFESFVMSQSASSSSLIHFLQENKLDNMSMDFLSSYFDQSNHGDNSRWQNFQNESVHNNLWMWGDDEYDTSNTQSVDMPSKYPETHAVLTGDSVVENTITLSPSKDTTALPASEKLDLQKLSLLEISLEDICPGPARGELGFNDNSDTDSYYSLSMDESEDEIAGQEPLDHIQGIERKIARKYLYRKSLVPTQQQLLAMDLVTGENDIVFEAEGCEPVTAQLFLWPNDAKLVVVDIEGVIASDKKKSSKSNNVKQANNNSDQISQSGWRSLFYSLKSSNSSADRDKDSQTDIIQLFNDIAKNGYKILYIASKSMTQSSSTKVELTKATDKSKNRLPKGPVFLSPDTLLRSFDPQRPELFKAAVLRGTKSLFPLEHNPFYAGFCTSSSEMHALMRCGFPEGRIFLVNQDSEVQSMNRVTRRTYKEMHQFIHEIFPAYHDTFNSLFTSRKQRGQSEDAYSDFNFWRIPMKTV